MLSEKDIFHDFLKRDIYLEKDIDISRLLFVQDVIIRYLKKI
jgi:hypothetical protein